MSASKSAGTSRINFINNAKTAALDKLLSSNVELTGDP
jgi:hypothetical protein